MSAIRPIIGSLPLHRTGSRQDEIFPVDVTRALAVAAGNDLVGIETGKGTAYGGTVWIDKNDLPDIIFPGEIEKGIELLPPDCNLALVFHQDCKIVPARLWLEKKDILPYE